MRSFVKKRLILPPVIHRSSLLGTATLLHVFGGGGRGCFIFAEYIRASLRY